MKTTLQKVEVEGVTMKPPALSTEALGLGLKISGLQSLGK